MARRRLDTSSIGFEPEGSHSGRLVRVTGLKRLDIADFAEAAYGVTL